MVNKKTDRNIPNMFSTDRYLLILSALTDIYCQHSQIFTVSTDRYLLSALADIYSYCQHWQIFTVSTGRYLLSALADIHSYCQHWQIFTHIVSTGRYSLILSALTDIYSYCQHWQIFTHTVSTSLLAVGSDSSGSGHCYSFSGHVKKTKAVQNSNSANWGFSVVGKKMFFRETFSKILGKCTKEFIWY